MLQYEVHAPGGDGHFEGVFLAHLFNAVVEVRKRQRGVTDFGDVVRFLAFAVLYPCFTLANTASSYPTAIGLHPVQRGFNASRSIANRYIKSLEGIRDCGADGKLCFCHNQLHVTRMPYSALHGAAWSFDQPGCIIALQGQPERAIDLLTTSDAERLSLALAGVSKQPG